MLLTAVNRAGTGYCVDRALRYPQNESNETHGGDNLENLLLRSYYSGSCLELAARTLFCFAVAIITIAPSDAAPVTPGEDQFRPFYEQFLAAVRANDKAKIADLIAFPVNAWAQEKKGNVDEISIPNRADFLAKYDSLFTPSMRSHALKAKPQKISNDHYAVIWHDTNVERSFEFGFTTQNGFRLTSYLVGPR